MVKFLDILRYDVGQWATGHWRFVTGGKYFTVIFNLAG